MAQARRLIWLYYAFQITVTLMLWMPIFYEYQKQMGLSDGQILDIQSLYYVSFCLFELPTGFIADRLGHRGCMRVGAALHVVTHALPVIWPTYWGFVCHWLLLALSRSLISGAASAYVYNQLEQLGQVELYKETEGRGRAWSLAVKVIGFTLTDPLTQINVSLPYVASALSAVVSTVIAWRFPPALRHLQVKAEPPRIGRAVALLLGHPKMVVVMLQGVALFTLTRIVQVNVFQPLLLAQGFVVSQFGRILAVNTLFEALGSAYPKIFRRLFSDLHMVFLLTLAMGVCCWGLARGGSWNCLIWLNVFAVVTGLAYPIQRQVMNEHIPDSDYRASLLSAESLVDRAVCAWVAHALGVALTQGAMPAFLQGSAMASLASCVLLWPLYALVPRRLASATAAEASKTPAP